MNYLNLNSQLGTFKGKRVLVTGHTGFKGSWLCEWLLSLGAEITGFALPPATRPALFDQLDLASRIRHMIGDIRDPDAVKNVVLQTQPDFVFHLAAQPLVRLSYREPVETWQTNVMGTINVLEALRQFNIQQTTNDLQPKTTPCVAVMVTTDKVYENREWTYGYREEDPLGGYDPYSSSKGAAEIAIASWRRSFFQSPTTTNQQLATNSEQRKTSNLQPTTLIASARAGNVIGGGDWAEDRIVPDACGRWQLASRFPFATNIRLARGSTCLSRFRATYPSPLRWQRTTNPSPRSAVRSILARPSIPIARLRHWLRRSSSTGQVGGRIEATHTRHMRQEN